MDVSFWLDAARPSPRPPLEGDLGVDVAIVGAGFTGLWTAIRLAETDPGLRIAVVDAAFVGFGASGRNGGFCEASLVHGRANGERHFPDEVDLLERLGRENLAELVAFIRERRIDCDLETTGVLTVADRPHGVAELRDRVDEAALRGEDLVFLDRDAVQAEVHSPLWLAGVLAGPEEAVLVDPAKLCRGLARVAEQLGVTIHEGTRAVGLERIPRGVRVRTVGWSAERDEPFGLARRMGLSFEPSELIGRQPAPPPDAGRPGTIRAGHVVIATSAYSGWYPRLASLFVPVYDYVLVSEPLDPGQREAIGWAGRQAMTDTNNQFHYFRLTADDRILWGGYDAIYHAGNGIGPRLRPQSGHVRAARPPVPRGVPAARRARLPVSLGRGNRHDQPVHRHVRPDARRTGDPRPRLHRPRSRRLALGGRDRARLHPPARFDLLRLELVRSAPFPFPPEPVRSIAVNLVRHELDRADRNDGRRGLLLRALDAVGIGFDS